MQACSGGCCSLYPWSLGPECVEASIVALPLVCNSAVSLWFYGSLSFFHKHPWLWSSLLPSLQSVSLHLTAAHHRVCSPNPMFQCSASIHNGRPTSQAGACRIVAWTFSGCLILSCLPQTCCCTIL